MLNTRILSWMPYLTVVLLFIVLWIGLDFNGLYGQDAHEYLRYSNALKNGFATGTSAGDFFWPKLFPFLGALVSYTGLTVNMSLQMISLFSILGALYFLQRTLKLLYQTEGTWMVLLGAATQVYFIRSGLFVMSDALATFWLMGVLYFYLKFRNAKELKSFMLLLGFSIAAFFTRYAALPLIAIPLLHACWLLLSRWSLMVRIVVGMVILGVGFTLIVINGLFLELVGRIFASWHFEHLFQRNFMYESYPQSYWVPNGVYIWSNFAHFGFLSCGVLLFFWWRRWNFQLKWIWVGLIAYLIFLGGIGFQNQRFMVISHLWILALIFPAFASLKDWLSQRKLWSVFVVGVLVFNASFFYYSFSKLFAMHVLEKEISTAVLKLDAAPKVYTFYVTPSMGSYAIPNKRVDLWEEDIAFEKGGYIVFNVEQFKSTTRVMKRWERVNREFDLEIIDELPENWKIYRIQ